MARQSSIPDILLMPVFEQWQIGKTATQIAIWLQQEHGITCNQVTVSRRIKELKAIELQAKKEAIAERASEQALDYIIIMDRDILKLDKITKKLMESEDNNDLMLAKHLLEIKLKNIDKQMNLTGMDKTEKDLIDQSVIVEQLLDKLGKTN